LFLSAAPGVWIISCKVIPVIMKRLTPNNIIILIIVIIGIFYIFTIREGHQLCGDDDCMYIHHAKNIVEGRPYNETGYIYEYRNFHYSPRNYPPVFPVLLAPVYAMFGLNFTAFKIENIIIFLATLFMIFLIFKRELPLGYVILIIIVLGFNPYFWELKDYVLSEIAFLFFSYSSLLFFNTIHHENLPLKEQYLYAVLGAILIYLAAGTRIAGILFIPCLISYDILFIKKITRFTIIVTFLFTIFLLGQNLLLHSSDSYLGHLLAINPRKFLTFSLLYLKHFGVYWHNGYSRIIGAFVVSILSGLFIIGYVKRIKKSITFFELFIIFYIMILIVTPGYGGTRYLMPLFPLFLFYIFYTINDIESITRRRIILLLVILMIFGTYVARYTQINFGPIEEKERITRRELVDLFHYIKYNTTKNDVIVIDIARATALFTGRKTAIFPRNPLDNSAIITDDKDITTYLKNIHAIYLISGDNASSIYKHVNLHKDDYQEVYSNSEFQVYKIKPN
jgi:hypothetical protein